MNRLRLATKLGVLLAALLAYGHSAVLPVGGRYRVLIPAERAAAVVPPFQVDVLSQEGDRGVRVPAGAGRGWVGEAGGSATYRFYVPADADYTLWAYCLWRDVCSNAVFVQVDDSERVILGNDPELLTWHWVRGVAWPLSRGTHQLTLSNHSDGVAIRTLALLSDPLEHPSGGQEAYYDIFYDGFDGCDGGNFVTWVLPRENWRLREPSERDRYLYRVLEGDASGLGPANPPTMAVVGDDTWKDYAVNASVMVRQPGLVGLCFNWQGPDRYDAIVWHPSAGEPSTQVALRLVRTAGAKREVLATFTAPLGVQEWHEIQVTAHGGRLVTRVDGAVVGEVEFADRLAGRVGLLVAQGCVAWFDDVHVRCLASPGD